MSDWAEILNKDEEILWEGKPDLNSKLSGKEKRVRRTDLFFSLFSGLYLFIFFSPNLNYVFSTGLGKWLVLLMPVSVILLIYSVISLLIPRSWRYALQLEADRYILTNKRALIAINTPTKYMPSSQPRVRQEWKLDGSIRPLLDGTSVLFGYERSFREALLQKPQEAGGKLNVGFEMLSNAGTVHKISKEQIARAISR